MGGAEASRTRRVLALHRPRAPSGKQVPLRLRAKLSAAVCREALRLGGSVSSSEISCKSGKHTGRKRTGVGEYCKGEEPSEKHVRRRERGPEVAAREGEHDCAQDRGAGVKQAESCRPSYVRVRVSIIAIAGVNLVGTVDGSSFQ